MLHESNCELHQNIPESLTAYTQNEFMRLIRSLEKPVTLVEELEKLTFRHLCFMFMVVTVRKVKTVCSALRPTSS